MTTLANMMTDMNLIGVPYANELISGIGVGFNCFTGEEMTGALAANPTIQNLGCNSQSFFKICYSAEDFNISNVNSWISSIAANPTQTPSIASSINPPLSLMNGIPVFNYLVPTQPLFGDTSNEPFQDIDVGSEVSTSSSTSTSTTALNAGINGSIYGHNSPTASGTYSQTTSQTTGIAAAMSNIPVLYMITVWGNNNVAQFYASYNTLNYTYPFAHGAADVSSYSGETLFLTPTNGDDGVDSLDNQVYISKMSGQVSSGVITQLSFTDSANYSITQPKSASGSSFSWSLPAGATLIGFQGYGNSSNLLGLQPICIIVKPANWLAPSIETQPFVTTLPVSTLGVGYNSFLGSALPNSALNSSACTSIDQGAQSEVIMKICASRQSLSETLSKTTGFSLGVAGFKLSHSKTKTKSIQVTDTDVTVVLITRVVTSSPVSTPTTKDDQFFSSNVTTQISEGNEPDAAIAGLFYYAVTSYLYVAASNGNLYWYLVGWSNGVPSLSYVGSNTSYTGEAPVSLTFFPAGKLTNYDCLLLGGISEATEVIFNAQNPSSTPTLYGYLAGDCQPMVYSSAVCQGANGLYFATPSGNLHYQPYSGFNASLAPIWTVPSGQVILSLAYSPNTNNVDQGNYPDGAIFIATAPSNLSNSSMGSIWVCDVSNNTVGNAAQQDATISGSPWAIIADANLNYMCATGSGGVFLSTLAADNPQSKMLVANVVSSVAGNSSSTDLVSGAPLAFTPQTFGSIL